MRRPRRGKMRPPWESEEAAFSFLLRAVAVAVVIVLISLALKAIL
ncbi:MAG: hypothetical protein QOE11_2398 [Solirubrobacteraceae bacterium]|jgi:hypothetical protein|nr:hypothetical protein [Solirubrobacteraceae bacterium]